MTRKKFRSFVDIGMFFLFIIGVGFFAYPFVSDTLNNFLDQQIISQYQKEASKENEKEMAILHEKMDAKNKQLAKGGGNPGADPFYEKTAVPKKTDPTYLQSHTIGVLTIPKIDVRLPIFDQTNAVLLEKGVSLLEGTSYPTGGKSTHAVLSGHRGLPQATLFTDLPQLVVNDEFYIEINGQILAYQVDQIKTIEPTNTQDLIIEPENDFVTLLTCTPYMVNSHRLLVRGHRVPYEKKKLEKAIKKISDKQQRLMIILICVGLLLIGLVIFLGNKKRKKRYSSN